MKCPKCKTKLPKKTKYCNMCGTKIKHPVRNIGLIILVIVLCFGVAGIWWICNKYAKTPDADNVNSSEKNDITSAFAQAYKDAISIETTTWPSDSTSGDALVQVTVPNLYAVYQSAVVDERYNGSNLQEIMLPLLEKYPLQEQIMVSASLTAEGWLLDEEEMNRKLTEISIQNANNFLRESFSDMAPIEINYDPEVIE